MDLIGAIITWVIGLPVALILGCFLGVGAFLLHRAYPGNQIVRYRIIMGSVAVVLATLVGVVLALGTKWLLLVGLFSMPLLLGNVAGNCN